jgi:hypothetical protein
MNTDNLIERLAEEANTHGQAKVEWRQLRQHYFAEGHEHEGWGSMAAWFHRRGVKATSWLNHGDGERIEYVHLTPRQIRH